MPYWLFKTEPDTYGWEDLVRDRKARWDGVTNNVALKHLRSVRKGDKILIYHTGGQRAVIGIAMAAGNPYPDPSADNDRIVVVDLVADKKLPDPVRLTEIRQDPAFAEWDLLRNSRLSIMPVPSPIWKRILKLAGAG